jgi:AcrR family transcriptional regulator
MAREPKETVRDRILASAEDLFWRYGIKKVTVDEIALAADVGKGTVYLHFDSKEEIAVAIIGKYKTAVLDDQIAVAADKSIPFLERLKQVTTLPVAAAHKRVNDSPMVIDLINAAKPHFGSRMTELVDREVQVIANLICEANLAGETHVENVNEAARQIKIITLGYMPGSTVCAMVHDPVKEVGKTVEFIYKGLH